MAGAGWDAERRRQSIGILDLSNPSSRQVTRFTDQFIFAFAWSRDGKRLALARGTVSSDVVLLTAQK